MRQVLLAAILLASSGTQFDPSVNGDSVEIQAQLQSHELQETRNHSDRSPRPKKTTIQVRGCGGHGTTQTSCDGLVTSALAVCEGDFIARPRMVYTYNQNNVLLASNFIAGDCSTNPAPNLSEPVNITARDFQQLPLKGSGIEIIPERDSYYINLPILTATRNQSQTLTTTVLGTPVTVKATPSGFAWDHADPTNTAPATGQKNSHTYSTPGIYTITLTTQWTGQFSTNSGGTWHPISGAATTTDTSGPLTLKQSFPRLAASDSP